MGVVSVKAGVIDREVKAGKQDGGSDLDHGVRRRHSEGVVPEIRMGSETALSQQLETCVEELVASGRFSSRSEVLREGLRLLREREGQLAALDSAIALGLADADAGRVRASDDVFQRLHAKYAAPVDAK